MENIIKVLVFTLYIVLTMRKSSLLPLPFSHFTQTLS